MSKYVIDAYAWIEYLRGSRAGEKVKAVFEEENSEIYTCAVTIAEVVNKRSRALTGDLHFRHIKETVLIE